MILLPIIPSTTPQPVGVMNKDIQTLPDDAVINSLMGFTQCGIMAYMVVWLLYPQKSDKNQNSES